VQVKSPRLIYVFGKRPGETTLYAVDATEQVILSRRVSVTHNLTRLRSALRDMLPDANIDVRSVDGTVVLSGDAATAREVEDARRLARRLVKEDDSLVTRIAVTAPNQVQLRVRVAEVSRDILKQLGINWDSAFGFGAFALGLATGNPAVAAGTFITRSAVGGKTTNSLFGSFSSGRFDINGVIDALDSEGLITILAEPNLTALSGEQATFLAGGEFPIIVPDSNNRITVQFKQFGVSLAFKPTLVDDGRISLKVNPEVSQLSNAGEVKIENFTIPALTTRRAQTTVELGSGQSFVIAGLLQNNITHDISKFPGLGDLPVLGPLFRSDGFRRNESELVIIVTPYVVRPVSTQLAAPTDGIMPPSDFDRVLLGKTQGTATGSGRPGPAGADGTGLVGSVGYVLD
jgi:pilus assembly protein CpaC